MAPTLLTILLVVAVIGLILLGLALYVKTEQYDELKLDLTDAVQAQDDLTTQNATLSQTADKYRGQYWTEVSRNNQLSNQVLQLCATVDRAEELADQQLAVWKKEHAAEIRKDAIKKSQFVTNGFVAENFAPLLSSYHPKDFRHLGDPIDYIVCVGADGVRNGEKKEIEEVILLEIKTGKAQLSKIQRRIRDAVAAGRVRFAVYYPDTDSTRYWPEKLNEEE